MQGRIKPDEISIRLKKYIEICTSAKAVLDHYFEESDYFFHPEYGFDTVDRNLGDGRMFPFDSEHCTYEIPTSESIWYQLQNRLMKKCELLGLRI